MKRLFLTFFCSVGLMLNPFAVSAADVATTCDYEAEFGVNPDKATINCLLTETALAYDVPPEIVKAIAEKENGGWNHFDENGEVIISDDNGIGLMQITNQSGYDQERLKTDLVYNIQAGVEILNHMFERNDLPTINDGERDVIENWYFAIMAYNGTKPVNSPIVQATGERNTDAYQEQVFSKIDKNGLIDLQELPFTREDFDYHPGSDENIDFTTMNYQFTLPLTKTKHNFTDSQAVRATTDTRLRALPTTTSEHRNVSKGASLTIDGTFEYDKHNGNNHFVWYPVKTSDGKSGYIASSYLGERFTDVPADHYAAEAIYYLVDSGVIQGIGNNKFGINGVPLTRWQVALMITRAENLSLNNRPAPDFTDVNGHKYEKEIAAVVDEGYFNGTSDSTFEPEKTLTRSEMAAALDRIYAFPKASKAHPFDDVYADPNSWWYSDAVADLYEAGITNGAGSVNTFAPRMDVSREQFAVFLARSLNEEFRIK
ncbi:S-layer homology domain-containing protein [Oceanobacillus senegalensis]|uniref:S-layer homology domain-containing protein n=1 Tax=Oceanobacillus senegalensis TaxID=1936063 RepID=UPI000A311561|nr:S-layer homology domain-containing protein [Oceanobacillus senegalensis]